MFLNPFVLFENQKTNLVMIRSLLRRQGLEIAQKSFFHSDVLDLIDESPLFLNNGSKELIRCASTALIQGHPSSFPLDLLPDKTHSQSNLSQQDDLVNRNLFHLNLIAQITGSQVKVFTIFHRKLTSQKIGTKSKERVHLFATDDYQYILLSKTSTTPLRQSKKAFPSLVSPNIKNQKVSDTPSDSVGSISNIPSYGLPISSDRRPEWIKHSCPEWSCFIEDSSCGFALACCKLADTDDNSPSTGNTSEIQEEDDQQQSLDSQYIESLFLLSSETKAFQNTLK